MLTKICMYFVVLHGSDTKAWILETELTSGILANTIRLRNNYENLGVYFYFPAIQERQLLANKLKARVKKFFSRV